MDCIERDWTISAGDRPEANQFETHITQMRPGVVRLRVMRCASKRLKDV